MRAPTTVLGVAGVVLLVAAALWLLIAPRELLRYPTHFDQTTVATGTATFYRDPASGSPLNPQRQPLTIRRHVRVVASTRSRANVQETASARIGSGPPVQLLQGYVLDRSTMENLPGKLAYAYAPDNPVNRSPAYTVNFPLRAGAGPYPLWMNEIGTASPVRRAGAKLEHDGLALMPLAAHLSDQPVSAAYLDRLAALGLPRQTTAAQLKTGGVDAAALRDHLLPALLAADRAVAREVFAAPVPLRYFMSGDTRLLIEPKTGTIVSVADVDQLLSARPELSGLARLTALLEHPRYATSALVQSARADLQRLTVVRPVSVLRLQYSQTPSSVAEMVDYASGRANDFRVIRTFVPFVLITLGIVCVLCGSALATVPPRARVES